LLPKSIAGVLALFVGGAALCAQGTGVNARAAAVDAFGKRIQEYLDIRQKAVSDFDPLKPDADQATIAAREKALGEAIRTARAGSKAGDLFAPDVAPLFRSATKADFAKRSTHAKKLRLDELPH